MHVHCMENARGIPVAPFCSHSDGTDIAQSLHNECTSNARTSCCLAAVPSNAPLLHGECTDIARALSAAIRVPHSATG